MGEPWCNVLTMIPRTSQTVTCRCDAAEKWIISVVVHFIYIFIYINIYMISINVYLVGIMYDTSVKLLFLLVLYLMTSNTMFPFVRIFAYRIVCPHQIWPNTTGHLKLFSFSSVHQWIWPEMVSKKCVPAAGLCPYFYPSTKEVIDFSSARYGLV